ncbi:MAG TPA: hypothetical protein VFW80_08395 [Gaiellaceae bacterium]|nr:hypothetical protein [Gaiellaceae bacterium]
MVTSETYWLKNCHGFRVRSPRRRVGIVEDVLYGAELDRPSALAVRGGLFGARVELVPVESVEEISPRDRQISLRELAPSTG